MLGKVAARLEAGEDVVASALEAMAAVEDDDEDESVEDDEADFDDADVDDEYDEDESSDDDDDVDDDEPEAAVEADDLPDWARE